MTLKVCSDGRVVCVFHLKRRRFPADTGDPLYRDFRWIIAYYCIRDLEKRSDVLKRLAAGWGVVTPRRVMSELLSDRPERRLLLIVPLDLEAAEGLVQYTEDLDCGVVVFEKDVRVGGKIRRLEIPAVVFKKDVDAFRHMLLAVVLATIKNLDARLVVRSAEAVDDMTSSGFLETFAKILLRSFDRVRGELMRYPGLWSRRIGEVLRVGLAVRVLYDIG